MAKMPEEKRRESPSGYHFYSLYRECPRKHYIKYGLGFVPEFTGKALIFGGSVHEAIAHYYQHWDLPADKLINSTLKAFEKDLLSRQSEYENPTDYEDDLIRGPVLLSEWHRTWYKYDKKNYKLVEVENQRTVPLGPNDEFIMTVRPDRVFEEKATKLKIVPDVKTTGYSIDASFKTAAAQDQMTSYLWALAKMEPKWQMGECIIDVLFVRKSRAKNPKSLYGEPRAERPGTIYRSEEALHQFELGLFGTIMEVSQKYENLKDFHPEILFPRNGKDCSMFNCPYAEICRTHLDKAYLPRGFKRDPWVEKLELQKPKEKKDEK